VLIATTEGDPERERVIVQRLRAHRVDGVLIMGSGPNTELLNGLHADGARERPACGGDDARAV
jgi:LacI family transcriptional regulator